VTSSPSIVLLYKTGPVAVEDFENSIVCTVFGNLMKWWPTPRKWIPAEYIYGFIFHNINIHQNTYLQSS